MPRVRSSRSRRSTAQREKESQKAHSESEDESQQEQEQEQQEQAQEKKQEKKQVVSTPVVSRKESLTTRRRRRRTNSTASTQSSSTTSIPSTPNPNNKMMTMTTPVGRDYMNDDEDGDGDNQGYLLFTPKNQIVRSNGVLSKPTNASSLNLIDKQKLELIIRQYDNEVETRCMTLRTMGEQCCARVQRELAVQLFKLPTKLKQMTVREFKTIYGGDIDNLCRMESVATGQELTSRILQTLHSSSNNSSSLSSTMMKTPKKPYSSATTASSRLWGTGGKKMVPPSSVSKKSATESTASSNVGEHQVAAPMFDLQSALSGFDNPKDQLLQAQLLKQQLEAMMADLQRNM